MNLLYVAVGVAAALFAAMLAAIEAGRRIGLRRQAREGESTVPGAGAVEGAVFALLGLLIAFTFTSAASRFEARRQLIVQEANAVGTAWLRLDLLPEPVAAELRQAFRLYLDSRIAVHRSLGDRDAALAAVARSGEIQARIWRGALAAIAADGRPQVATLVAPALNEMFDIGAARVAAVQAHVPIAILVFLFCAAVLAALLAGHAMASKATSGRLHRWVFAAITSLTIYVILDVELPRFGAIRVAKSDQILVDLRAGMR